MGRGMVRGAQRREVTRVFHQDLFGSLGTGKAMESSLLQTWDQTRGFGREKGSEGLKLTHLLSWPSCFSGRLAWWVSRECLLVLGAGRGQWNEGSGRRLEEAVCVVHGDGGREEGEGAAGVLLVEVGIRLKDWIWRRGGRER